jgi:hypothetical protein
MLIRWYWWRLNGYGFATGMVAGMIAAIIQKIVFPDVPEYISFGWASGISLIGVIIGTYATPPTNDDVLFNFYRTTRPFGFWRHIRGRLSDEVIQSINKENRRDLFSIFLAIPWQLILFLSWMMILVRAWDQLTVLLILLVVISVILYFSWYRHLRKNVTT